MYFKQILDEHCGCASYVIASRQSNEVAIVDPAIETAQYAELLRDRHFTLRYVIDTHVHADHVSGARKLVAECGGELCMFEQTAVAYPFRPLRDQQELPLGQLRLRVWHTPGHRAELISLLVINPLRSPAPSMVLTADSLLVGDVGRPDFGGGAAEEQYESVRKLLQLPDWMAVFPGHFEGPCGHGMCGRPSTTIGFERRFNPTAGLAREAFVQAVAEQIPARPLNMLTIEATNWGEADAPWAMLTSAPSVPEVDLPALAARSPRTFLLDVREPDEYAIGHVPGAVNIPQAELASKLDEIPQDRPLMVICQGGARSLRAAQFLKQIGYDRVVSVAGGTNAWQVAGNPLTVGAVDATLDPGATRPIVADSAWTHAGVR